MTFFLDKCRLIYKIQCFKAFLVAFCHFFPHEKVGGALNREGEFIRINTVP